MFVMGLGTVVLTTSRKSQGVNAFTAPTSSITSRKDTSKILWATTSTSSVIEENYESLRSFSSERDFYTSLYGGETIGSEWYDEEYDFDDEEDDDDEDDGIYDVSGYRELQKSKGSEVLDEALQSQVDEMNGGEAFLEKYSRGDASWMEKVAMSSVTEQLPLPAREALHLENGQQTGKSKGAAATSSTSQPMLNYGSARISHEHELELAKTIQEGAALFRLREKLEEESEENELFSRTAWAEAAGLDSTKDLRHKIHKYRQAKHALVKANMGLVHTVVHQQYSNRFRIAGITKDEMVQEASLGLLRAAELFDPKRGLRFSTYAVVWIKGVLSNSHLPELVRLPAREKTKWNKIMEAQQSVQKEKNGVQATVEELAYHTGLNVAEIVQLQRRMNSAREVLSLDYENRGTTRSGGMSTSLDPFYKDKGIMADTDLAERTQLHADVLAAMAANLTPREARLIRLRYGLADGDDGRGRTLQECADAMGLSYAGTHKIAKKCLEKLREADEMQSLDEYLLTIA